MVEFVIELYLFEPEYTDFYNYFSMSEFTKLLIFYSLFYSSLGVPIIVEGKTDRQTDRPFSSVRESNMSQGYRLDWH